MHRFNRNDYISGIYGEEGKATLMPTKEGVELIAQYLGIKYGANICCPVRNYTFRYTLLGWDYQGPPYRRYVSPDTPKCYDLIQAARAVGGENHRQAFILEIIGGIHAVFMAYIREASSEMILYSDSIGSSSEIANQIHQKTGLDVFITPRPNARQEDQFSCYTDALVFGRDVTGISPTTGHYLIPNLSSLLSARSFKISDGVYETLLPNDLLKTAQRSDFIHKNEDKDRLTHLIHKQETLHAFRKRYSETSSYTEGTTKEISSYLRIKSEKYVLNMEIQFYLNEINEELGGTLSKEKKMDFIKHAKRAHQEERDLYDVAAETFLAQHATYHQQEDSISPHPHDYPKSVIPDILSSEEKTRIAVRFHQALAHDELSKDMIKEILSGKHGLAALDDLLQTYAQYFSAVLCIQLIYEAIYEDMHVSPSAVNNMRSRIYDYNLGQLPAGNYDPRIINLMLSHEGVIQHLHKRHELYILAQKDTYIAERLLMEYPQLFDKKEITALQWIVENVPDTAYQDELTRLRTFKETPEERGPSIS